jgi:hypothetical protein
MADDRDLDAQLDRALASYADEEPDPALRTRILARAAEATPRPKRFWLLAPAATCAAAVLIALLLHPPTRSPRLAPAAQPAIASAPELTAPAPAAPRQTVHPHAVLAARPTRRSARSAIPRTGSFPSPSPLTAEESILLNFAASHPEQARQVLTSAAADRAPLDTKPLSIEPIHIAALSEPEETQHLQ